MPAVSGGHGRVEVARDEAEVGGRELPAERVAVGVAAGLELLEVRELAHVDLGGEVAADRLLERLVALERSAGKRPGTGERLARALPEQHLRAAARAPAGRRRARRGTLFSTQGHETIGRLSVIG